MSSDPSFPPDLPARFKAGRWYSAGRFWRKITHYALVAGRKTVLTSLTLFHCLRDKDTPSWAKGIIMGALGYLVLPVDLIPDVIPGIGFTDDWAALVAALGAVSMYVKDEHKLKASIQAEKIFGLKSH
jgi:uncharacterized membrane protein YkvA (DUF1232 family)